MEDGRASHDVLARAEKTWSHWGKRVGFVVVPIALDLGLRISLDALAVSVPYVVGTLLLLVTCAYAVGAQRRSMPSAGAWVVPLVVIAAVGLMRLVPESNSLGMLVLLPAMWLGIDKRMVGAVVAGVAMMPLLTAPAVLYYGAGPAVVARVLPICLVATLAAVSLAWIADQWRGHEDQLKDQQRQLREALARVTAGQVLNDAVVGAVDVGLVALHRDGAYSSMNPHHQRFMELAFPDGHRGYAGQTGWVFEADGTTFLAADKMPTIRAKNGEEYTDYLIWVGEEPAQRRALAVSARRVEGGDDDLASVLVYKDVTDLMRALKVKDEFVATVSHELRTPLTSILGYLDLALLDVPDQDPRRSHLQVVHRNARRLLRLVNDLLLTAQTDRGVLDLDQRPIDLTAVVEECVRDLWGRANAAQVTLETGLVAGVWVCGDRERIAEVIDNLLTNAVKYSHAGGTVRVCLFEREAGGRHDAVLTVGDDGIGIGEQDQERLFTRFFRTPEAQRRAIQGVGLGLSISKSIVEGHGGDIEVASVPDEGTVFTVRLPAAVRPLDLDLSALPGSLGAVT